MLRMETLTGWWLITHPDHARLAGAIASVWGNELFQKPEPRARVLYGISAHDDGWAARDAEPSVTRAGKPAAFSSELVGKYSAFEEIDLADYLAVRDRAVRMIADRDPYAGLLISMHTYNLLSERADRSTIRAEDLPRLDAFLESQAEYQDWLWGLIDRDASLSGEEKSEQRVEEHFRLLQACDNLSLLACVAYGGNATLLHPLARTDGGGAEVQVSPLGKREFRLTPWPFEKNEYLFEVPARHVEGKGFADAETLARAFHEAEEKKLLVRLAR